MLNTGMIRHGYRQQTRRGWRLDFSPSNISGLMFWVKDSGTYQSEGGSAATADGDPVGQWQDLSSNVYHVTQATSAAKPTLKTGANGINNRSVVRFDGGDNLKRALVGGFTGTSGSIFIVYRLTGVVNNVHALLASGDEGSSACMDVRGLWQSGTNQKIFLENIASNTDVIRGSTTINASTAYLAAWFSNGTTYTMRLNGASETITVAIGGNSGDWWGDVSGKDNITVGARINNATGVNLSGDIGEILVYDSQLTGTNLSNVETYLANRWGITIP